MSTQWIGGIHSISLLLEKQPERVIQIFIADQRSDQKIQSIVAAAKTQKISVQQVNVHKLDQLLPNINHQSIGAQIKSLPELGEHDLKDLVEANEYPLFLILDSVQDPHNLGACLRSADAAGVTAVIIPKDRAASLNPTVRKVASGAAECVPLVTVTNLARAMRILQTEGVFLIGLAGEASEFLFQTDLKGKIALVLGAEENGLRRLTREHCDVLAKLPMFGSVSSLNVSVACGVSLFEAVRQRIDLKK